MSIDRKGSESLNKLFEKKMRRHLVSRQEYICRNKDEVFTWEIFHRDILGQIPTFLNFDMPIPRLKESIVSRRSLNLFCYSFKEK